MPDGQDADLDVFAPDFQTPDAGATPSPAESISEAGQPPPDDGKGATPPDNGKGSDAQKAGQDEAASREGGEAQPEAPETPSAEDLKAALSFGKPEETMEGLKRDLQASSREAQRLVEERKAFEAMLSEQGLKLDKDAEGQWHMVPTKKGGRSNEFDALSEKDQSAFKDLLLADDTTPEDVWAFVASKSIRAAATAEKVVRPISEERMESAVAAVAEKAEGMHKDVRANLDLIRFQVDGAPKEVKEAFWSHPEMMLQYMNARVELAKQSLKAHAQRKAQEQKEKLDAASKAQAMTAAEGVTPSIASGSDAAVRTAIDTIVNA